MDEQFDKKLSSRIREVFDNYESPPADEAWLELRKKFPVKQERKIAWLWWSSAAALLLVFLGVGLWLMNNKPQTGNNVAVKPQIQQQQPNQATPNPTPAGSEVTSVNPLATTGTKNDSAVQAPNKALAGPAVAAGHDTANNARKTGSNAVATPGNTLAINSGSPASVATNKQLPGTATIAGNTPAAGQTVVTGAITNNQQVAAVDVPTSGNGQTAPVITNKTSPVIAQQPVKTIDDLFAQDKAQRVAKQKTDKKELKKVDFSVYAATYMNYAQGSANQINAGAGFTSDIRLSKNIKLSTGVSLAQNTLSYAGQPPASGSSNSVLSAASPGLLQNDALNFGASATVAELQNYRASLMGLDVPINIKYEFNPEKSDTYISAGLSSGTFIDERYTSHFAYKNAQGYASAVTQDQTYTQSFNSFYFGKTLNLSFGTGFPIGRNNRLVVEPFLKYPLGGLGAQAIHFGAGGVNLKFNFKTTKK
ncbi:hypothetical protein [Mucilaginibacter psychrotolerans]|uniref:Outer membrane protein beta-barrel domain-containing protein n=1 Tax=Mucilaginibacter psychrotolerans TaxID=1524096 RepID=A0A4Y8S8N6_9SPHI|nr:hypothetical protein [Mucilaginibacter psychrotolerans]TFF35389.1 hypothetical protein E2R66_19225 [Mucilaginibacter psychrotolerans]